MACYKTFTTACQMDSQSEPGGPTQPQVEEPQDASGIPTACMPTQQRQCRPRQLAGVCSSTSVDYGGAAYGIGVV
jgi:hypothetical protein